MTTETIFAQPAPTEDADTWWAKKTLLQVLQENAQLQERLAKTKAALSYSEALLSGGEIPQPPLPTVPPLMAACTAQWQPPLATVPHAVAASAAARRLADPPAQPEKRQKLC